MLRIAKLLKEIKAFSPQYSVPEDKPLRLPLMVTQDHNQPNLRSSLERRPSRGEESLYKMRQTSVSEQSGEAIFQSGSQQ